MNVRTWNIFDQGRGGIVIPSIKVFVIAIVLGLSACGGSEKEATGITSSSVEKATSVIDAPKRATASAPRTPEMEATDAAKRWLDNMNTGNFSAALETTIGAMRQMIAAAMEGGEAAPVPFPEYQILRTEMVDDELAHVIIAIKGDAKEETLHLIKLGGKWLASPERLEIEAIRVTKGWLDSLNAGNQMAAQELSTEQTKRLMGALGVTIVPREYRIHEVEIVNDNRVKVGSYVEFIDKNTVFDIQRSGGKWRVDLNANDWW